jgi:hypothetical protein
VTAGPPLGHLRAEKPAATGHAEQVDADDPLPVLLGVREQRAHYRDSRVVHHHVGDAHLGAHPVGEALHVGRDRDIHLPRVRRTAAPADQFADRGGGRQVQVGGDDPRAVGGEPQCGRPADPAPGTGHHDQLVSERLSRLAHEFLRGSCQALPHCPTGR